MGPKLNRFRAKIKKQPNKSKIYIWGFGGLVFFTRFRTPGMGEENKKEGHSVLCDRFGSLQKPVRFDLAQLQAIWGQ